VPGMGKLPSGAGQLNGPDGVVLVGVVLVVVPVQLQ
jgi:hypothetical protein